MWVYARYLCARDQAALGDVRPALTHLSSRVMKVGVPVLPTCMMFSCTVDVGARADWLGATASQRRAPVPSVVRAPLLGKDKPGLVSCSTSCDGVHVW